MSNLRLHLSQPRSAGAAKPTLPLGRYLVNAGIISNKDLLHALRLQRHVDAPLGEILVSEGLAQKDDILVALSEQHHAQIVDLDRDPPQDRLAGRLPVSLCLRYRAVAWLDMAGTLLIATSRPHQFNELRTALGDRVQTILPVIADEDQIKTQISRIYGAELAQRAATRVPAALSCRGWAVSGSRRTARAFGVALLAATAFLLTPLWSFTALVLWAYVTLLMTMGLKAAALWTQITTKTPEATGPDHAQPSLPYQLPRVSILVPLLEEQEIAGALITRLSRLTYPKSQLDVVLVLEEEDWITHQTLARTRLPPWISVIEVPQANQLTTKPRALNYALDFCRGSIIGVWDAEDAPEPDQIEQVVSRFNSAPQQVACLQGILDYYNSRANWLARCFTIEYAAWWRVMLPGVARLGLVLPLGGTTLFFRREVLEELSGWDAHNVTEDADLGVRLARRGYVTELIPTVTYEEANCRLWPWIRQRSRWLKGFLVTWAVHMRNPGQLKADLGWVRFFGVQTMLLATVSQFICAPILWSFWLALTPLEHPVVSTLGGPALWTMAATFILAATLNLALALVAVSGKQHRHLMWWVFTTPFYFPLGAVAAYKALYEYVVSPFFWDKTEHGVTPHADSGGEIEVPKIPEPIRCADGQISPPAPFVSLPVSTG